MSPLDESLNPNDDADASLIVQALKGIAKEAYGEQEVKANTKPLTEIEALWRIERALLRIANALEAK